MTMTKNSKTGKTLAQLLKPRNRRNRRIITENERLNWQAQYIGTHKQGATLPRFENLI